MNAANTGLMWGLLILAATAYLGFLGFRLFQKGKAAFETSKPTLAAVQILVTAIGEKQVYERPADNLLDDVNIHLIERAKLVKSRELAAERRQRRLIDKLNNPQESESGHA